MTSLGVEDISYLGSAMNVTVSCKSQICDVGLGDSGCLWGPAQVAEYRRPSPPLINVSAGQRAIGGFLLFYLVFYCFPIVFSSLYGGGASILPRVAVRRV